MCQRSGESEVCEEMRNVTLRVRIALAFHTQYSALYESEEIVEKRKISYFGLALNLFQHLISPNQDDLSYSARTFISGLQNG